MGKKKKTKKEEEVLEYDKEIDCNGFCNNFLNVFY